MPVESDPYFGIEYKELNKRQYKPCACILKAKSRS
jgi:hypothetical protein